MVAKVTKRTVDALKPAPDRDQLLWDDELPGFGVRCRPGVAKSYFLKYRTQGGQQRWLTFGLHGPLTPEQARKKTLAEKAAIGEDDDPSGRAAAEAPREYRRRDRRPLPRRACRCPQQSLGRSRGPPHRRDPHQAARAPALGSIKITDLARADI